MCKEARYWDKIITLREKPLDLAATRESRKPNYPSMADPNEPSNQGAREVNAQNLEETRQGNMA